MTQQDQQTYLGLDIGTSSVKALMIGADQRVVSEASVPWLPNCSVAASMMRA